MTVPAPTQITVLPNLGEPATPITVTAPPQSPVTVTVQAPGPTTGAAQPAPSNPSSSSGSGFLGSTAAWIGAATTLVVAATGLVTAGAEFVKVWGSKGQPPRDPPSKTRIPSPAPATTAQCPCLPGR